MAGGSHNDSVKYGGYVGNFSFSDCGSPTATRAMILFTIVLSDS